MLYFSRKGLKLAEKMPYNHLLKHWQFAPAIFLMLFREILLILPFSPVFERLQEV
jgi:hypothetical protein